MSTRRRLRGWSFSALKADASKALEKGLGGVAGPDKPAAGKRFNEVKQAIEAAFAAAQERMALLKASGKAGPLFDRTLPGIRPRVGHLHPLAQTADATHYPMFHQIEGLFIKMGGAGMVDPNVLKAVG